MCKVSSTPSCVSNFAMIKSTIIRTTNNYWLLLYIPNYVLYKYAYMHMCSKYVAVCKWPLTHMYTLQINYVQNACA